MRHLIVLLITTIGLLGPSSTANAVDYSRQFLDGLRERGFHDYALEYLDRVAQDPQGSPELKKVIDFERGTTLITLARTTGDPQLRAKLFDQANTVLAEFVKQQSGTLLAAQANNLLANAINERARGLARKAEQPSQVANRAKLATEARQFFDQAMAVFQKSEAFYRDELKDKKKFPKTLDPKKDATKHELRQQYRSALLQTRLLIATVLFEKAKTFVDDKKQRDALLTEAAKQYGELYDKYDKWLAGLYARLYQGRCQQEMGKYEEAIKLFEDVLLQPHEAPAFRPLLAKAYVSAAECWNVQKAYTTTIEKCQKWVDDARGAENQAPDFLAAQLQIALAYEGLSKSEKPEFVKDQKKFLKEAVLRARKVARMSPELKKPARELLARLVDSGDVSADPTTFNDAFDAAKDSLDLMTAKAGLLPTLQKNNPEAAEKAAEEIAAARQNAMRLFGVALGLVDDEVEINQVNLVRYFLCYLNYQSRRFYDAAVLGEFLARKYPDSGGARDAAKIAMASYAEIYNDPNNTDRSFDAGRVLAIAELIAKRWAGQTEADEAYKMLVAFNLQEKRFPEAIAALQKMTPDYTGRAKAELRVGQSLWSEYLRKSRLPEEERPAQEKLDEMKQTALSTLNNGIDQMRAGGQITSTVANASLSLAQIYTDLSQYDDTIAILEDQQIGPLTLVKNQHPATARAGYAESVYKTALRAYVTVNPPRQEQAEQIMNALEAHVAKDGDAGAKDKLTKIFVSLGLQLQKQMKLYQEQKRFNEIAQVSKSFESFLDRINKRDNDWATRNWIASTYYSLGTGQRTGKKLNATGKGYFQKAQAGFQKILDEVDAKKIEPPSSSSVLGVKLRLAECLQQLGEYRAALDMLSGVLKEKPMMLDAQIAAAECYRDRAQKNNQPKWYKYSIYGGRKDKKTRKNAIWGWGKLAKITSRHAQFRDLFYQARFNMTETRYLWALTKKGADRKEELQRALNDIRFMLVSFKQLGDERLTAEYERLAKKLQKELNLQADGLKSLKEKAKPKKKKAA